MSVTVRAAGREATAAAPDAKLARAGAAHALLRMLCPRYNAACQLRPPPHAACGASCEQRLITLLAVNRPFPPAACGASSLCADAPR